MPTNSLSSRGALWPLTVACLLAASTGVAMPPAGVRITVAEGTVEVSQQGAPNGLPIQVPKGDPNGIALQPLDRVRAGLGSRAVLRVDNQGVVTLPSGTLVEIQPAPDASFLLLRTIRLEDEGGTRVGTPFYMPGTALLGKPQADIFALGKVLYEVSTGRAAADFPALPTRLVDDAGGAAGFLRLNAIILRACDPDPRAGYPDAAALRQDLEVLQQALRARSGSHPPGA